MSGPFDPEILFLGRFNTEIIRQIKQGYVQEWYWKAFHNGKKTRVIKLCVFNNW